MRTDTLAVVFTDIKGYTAATSAQTHQQNARMLKRVERLIEPVVRAFNGRIVKSIGDAYMIVFRSPTQAVQCSAAIQDRVHQHNTNTSTDRAIHIRIAINIGDVRVQKGDVFGEPVNIAARIESVTPADEIYLSDAMYLTMNKTDLPTERVGEYDLKGIPEPVTVHRLQKYAHLQESDDVREELANRGKQAELPFGGVQLGHWRRVRWARRAYHIMLALAFIGLCGAGYLRYRPSNDYSDVLNRISAAIEAGNAMDALAFVGEIPESAVQERALVRNKRRDAVAILLQEGRIAPATNELNALLHEDERDAEALMLKAILLGKNGEHGERTMETFVRALELHPDLKHRAEVIQGVVQGYTQPEGRAIADRVVAKQLGSSAVPALIRSLKSPAFDRHARTAMATRLQKLGAGNEVDWVALAIEDLKSTSCKQRKAAIQKLVAESDERAVGPLMKHAETKLCASTQARRAAEEILHR